MLKSPPKSVFRKCHIFFLNQFIRTKYKAYKANKVNKVDKVRKKKPYQL